MERKDKILIGKITSPHGIRGEVRVYPYGKGLASFSKEQELTCCNHEGKQHTVTVEAARSHKGMVILKLKEINNRNQAEILRDGSLFLDEKNLPKLDDDEFYVKDLIGLSVYNVKDKVKLGVVNDVLTQGPQDIYEIKLEDGRTVYVPAVKEFIKAVDLANGISIALIEGLID